MAQAPPTYDLILLLDPEAEDGVRTKIVSSVRESISAQGELLRYDDWGTRALAYPIGHKTSAEYHLFQFHTGAAELIAGLSRTLHITDGIVRFRINKLAPGTPEAPDLRAAERHEPSADEQQASAPAAEAA